jgi:hypothetical protein
MIDNVIKVMIGNVFVLLSYGSHVLSALIGRVVARHVDGRLAQPRRVWRRTLAQPHYG